MCYGYIVFGQSILLLGQKIIKPRKGLYNWGIQRCKDWIKKNLLMKNPKLLFNNQ